MIALTWCAQLCEPQIILSVGSGASELVLGLLYLVKPLILFSSSFNPERSIIFTAFTAFYMSASAHPDMH